MTKKTLALTGPAAAAIAFKCPVCLLALAGLTAGAGSLAPFVQGIYWAIILGLGALFLGYLARSWKANLTSGWILVLGALGFISLIYQASAEPGGILAIAPVVLLSTASLAAFFEQRNGRASCCANSALAAQNALELSPKGKGYSESHGGLNMAKRRVEVFTSGCPLCEPVVELVKKTACSSCDVVIYDLNAGCATNECREKAKKYGVTRVPAVVVNGKLLECCKTGMVSEKELRAAGVGSP